MSVFDTIFLKRNWKNHSSSCSRSPGDPADLIYSPFVSPLIPSPLSLVCLIISAHPFTCLPSFIHFACSKMTRGEGNRKWTKGINLGKKGIVTQRELRFTESP